MGLLILSYILKYTCEYLATRNNENSQERSQSGSGLNINLDRGIPESNLYEFILREPDRIFNSMVERLANKKYGSILTKHKVKGADMWEEEEKEGWQDIVEGQTPMLELPYAIEVANFVKSKVSANIRTSSIDPNTDTFGIALYIGLLAGQLIENPRYNFQGTPIDLAELGVDIGLTVWASLEAARSGFTFERMSSSTSNIAISRRGDGSATGGRPRTIIDRVLNGAEKRSDKF